MPNFSKPEPPIFPADLPAIEDGEPATGGDETGQPNRTLKGLSDRTLWLRSEFESLVANSQNLIIGEDVQAYAAILDSLSVLNGNGVLRKTDANTIGIVPRWIDNSTACGRLTLESGVPYSDAGVSGDRIFYTPYRGNTIALYQNE